MANKKLEEAKKVGDAFVKRKIGKDFHYKINVLMAVILLLAVMLLYDAVEFLTLYRPSPVQRFTSVVEIIAVLVLGLIGYNTIKNLREWEDTYKRIKKLID